MAPVSGAQPRRIPPGTAYVAPLFLFMLLAFNLPIALMLSWSVAAPPDILLHYGQIFERAVYLKVLGNTFRIALIATVVCVLLGYPLAYWMRGLPPGRQLLAIALVVLPFWVSILVRTYSWIVILGNDGLVNRMLQGLGLTGAPISFLYNEFGVILGTANVLLPFMVLPLLAAMLRLDDRLLQAAASLGASSWTIFWRVFFPLTLPSLAAGAILVFILTLGVLHHAGDPGRRPRADDRRHARPADQPHAAVGAGGGDFHRADDRHACLLRCYRRVGARAQA
jgi:putative spermidine/putrescine transport system permease protein